MLDFFDKLERQPKAVSFLLPLLLWQMCVRQPTEIRRKPLCAKSGLHPVLRWHTPKQCEKIFSGDL